METHVRLLAAIQIAFGALGILAALIVLIIAGGAASVLGMTGVAQDPEAIMAIPIIAIVGVAIVALIVVLSIPSLIAGFGLLGFRPWARTLTTILCVIDLLNVPIGTAIGVYGLWVMLSTETEPLFRQNRGPQPGQNWNSHRAA
jgi:hypothetical protein